MLAQLGSVVFEVVAPNIHEVARNTGAAYAEKDVMGRRPPLEFVGEAPEEWQLSGKLFPAKFGGLEDLEDLHDQRMAGKALPFMRGDGVPLGWVVIEKIQEKSIHLDQQGVGQLIEVELSLKRADSPKERDVYSSIAGSEEEAPQQQQSRSTTRRRTAARPATLPVMTSPQGAG
jgi:phage protein U